MDKLNILRKYKVFAHLSDANAYAFTMFMSYFVDFETALRTSLQIMGVVMPKRAFQSARQMWRMFIYQVGEVSKEYVKDVEEVIVARNKIVHGGDPSLTPEEIMALTTLLRQTIRFVQTYCISSDILPELKEKYSRWLRPEIISVRIIQKNRTVFLEVATKTEHQTLADEAVKRTDLGFITDGTDKPMFPSERAAQVNAEFLVNQLDPYSIMMCSDLFTVEGCREVDELYRTTPHT
ncbi:MAG: hypothetical protein ACJ8BW_15900 [Ktedonobacteraceae bacterium]